MITIQRVCSSLKLWLYVNETPGACFALSRSGREPFVRLGSRFVVSGWREVTQNAMRRNVRSLRTIRVSILPCLIAVQARHQQLMVKNGLWTRHQ